MTITARALCLALFAVPACLEGVDGDPDAQTEIITTVTLTLTPPSGAPVVASFRDLDGDGGSSGTSDPLALVAATSYAMTVEFLDELGSPAKDITDEIEQEAAEHQVFVLGAAVAGPAMTAGPGALVDHVYADRESDYGTNTGDDLPVGLVHTMTTRAAGTGPLRIVLRHLPPLNDTAQKVAGLAESLAAGDPLPGEVDADVTFELAVQ